MKASPNLVEGLVLCGARLSPPAGPRPFFAPGSPARTPHLTSLAGAPQRARECRGIGRSSARSGRRARITVGRTVWRRETWHVPPAHGPACPEDAARWARDLGLPRRVFALSPGELKPIYIDFDSPVLTRIPCRQFRRVAADLPDQPVRLTEMLPGPDDCWLADQSGRRYTGELRLVAVDLARRPSAQSRD